MGDDDAIIYERAILRSLGSVRRAGNYAYSAQHCKESAFMRTAQCVPVEPMPPARPVSSVDLATRSDKRADDR